MASSNNIDTYIPRKDDNFYHVELNTQNQKELPYSRSSNSNEIKNQLSNSTKNFFDLAPKKSLTSNFWHYIKIFNSYLAYLSMRVTSLAISIFGKKGKGLAEKLNNAADVFLVCHYLNNLCELPSPPPLSRFVETRNIVHPNILKVRKDRQKAQEFIDNLLDPKFARQHQFPSFSKTLNTSLKEFKLENAQSEGICFGMTLFFLKSVLELKKEPSLEELCVIAKNFEKGGPEEAAGLQAVYQLLNDWRRKESVRTFYKMKNKQSHTIQLPSNEEHQIEKLCRQANFLYPKSFNKAFFNVIGSLVSLKSESHFQVQNAEFLKNLGNPNNTSCGYYHVCFPTYINGKSSRHFVLFIKTSKNSCLFDPNYGLLHCNHQNLSESFQNLFNFYSSNKVGIIKNYIEISKYSYKI